MILALLLLAPPAEGAIRDAGANGLRTVENGDVNMDIIFKLAKMNATELISGYGYPVQNFTVQTKDGFLLDVIRIPGTVQERRQFEEKQRREDTEDVATGKPAVLLMHGLLSSAEDFVIAGPGEGLAFYLADQGFDVFLGNARGNVYARKHTTLDPERDAAFWRNCWHDVGVKDLPAMIDEILRITEQSKLSYVGHMQGSTVFYVMASERPEYNKKVEMMVTMGPVAYLGNASNKMLEQIAKNQQSKSWTMKNLGLNEFHPSKDFMVEAGQQDCESHNVDAKICQNAYFLMNGFYSENYNMTTLQRYAPRLPAGASTGQVLHLAQLKMSGRFEKYHGENHSSSEEYDLGKITCHISMMYAPNDLLSSEQDVQRLIKALPNVVEEHKMTQIENNMDMLYSNNVRFTVYKYVLDSLKKN